MLFALLIAKRLLVRSRRVGCIVVVYSAVVCVRGGLTPPPQPIFFLRSLNLMGDVVLGFSSYLEINRQSGDALGLKNTIFCMIGIFFCGGVSFVSHHPACWFVGRICCRLPHPTQRIVANSMTCPMVEHISVICDISQVPRLAM